MALHCQHVIPSRTVYGVPTQMRRSYGRATSESRSPREGASTNSWSRFSCCRREPSNRGRFSVICCRARRRTGCRRLIHVPVASILSYGETACPFQNSASADRHMAPAQSTTLNHATAAISSKVGFQKQSLENITGAVSFHKRRVHHRTVPMGDDCPDQLAVGSIPNNAKGPGDREDCSVSIQPLPVHLSSDGTSCISSHFRTSKDRYVPSAYDVRASLLSVAARDACRSRSAHPYTRRIAP